MVTVCWVLPYEKVMVAVRGSVDVLSSSNTLNVLLPTPSVVLSFAQVTSLTAPHAVFEVMVMSCLAFLAGRSTIVGVNVMLRLNSLEAKTSVSSLSEHAVVKPRDEASKRASARRCIYGFLLFIYLVILMFVYLVILNRILDPIIFDSYINNVYMGKWD